MRGRFISNYMIFNHSKYRIIRNSIFISFWIRILFLMIRSFREPVHPHIWRQLDTLGVSMRYWLRFSTENSDEGWKILLPAVLQSGDGNGIMPMEFPVMNLVFSPLWALGPYWGKIAVYLLFGGLMSWLAIQLSKKGHFLGLGLLLLPTLSYSADYFEKFMPDTLAMMIMTWGCFKLIQNKIKGAFWITVALLMKPTSVVGLIFLFLFRSFRRNILSYFLPIITAFTVTILYYTKGLNFIESYRVGTESLFATAARNPFDALKGILQNPSFILEQILNRFFMAYGAIFVVIMIIFKRKKISLGVILWSWIGMLLIFTTLCMLDGPHLMQHDYYLLSGAPFFCAIFYFYLRNTTRWVAIVGCLLIVGHSVELAAQNIDLNKYSEYAKKKMEVQNLISRHPEFPWKNGHAFRSNERPYPTVGLYFGERQSSKTSSFGIYEGIGANELPSDCRTVDSGTYFSLVRCEFKSDLNL
jgi:hypothetical protein